MTERSFPAKMLGLAKRVLQTGFRALRRNHRVQSCHLQRPLRRRIELEIMEGNETRINEISDGLVISGLSLKAVTEATDFVASEAAGEGMGRYTGGRLAPTYDEIAQLAY